jgi:hypothetical protein
VTAIAGYAFNAEILCPRCTLEALGRTSVLPVRGGSSELESEMAVRGAMLGLGAVGDDPRWLDSGTMPQPVWSHELSGDEHCARCGEAVE